MTEVLDSCLPNIIRRFISRFIDAYKNGLTGDSSREAAAWVTVVHKQNSHSTVVMYRGNKLKIEAQNFGSAHKCDSTRFRLFGL